MDVLIAILVEREGFAVRHAVTHVWPFDVPEKGLLENSGFEFQSEHMSPRVGAPNVMIKIAGELNATKDTNVYRTATDGVSSMIFLPASVTKIRQVLAAHEIGYSFHIATR